MIWLPMFSDIFMERIWNLWKRDMKRQFLATEEILKGEIDAAMNEYNRKVKPKEE